MTKKKKIDYSRGKIYKLISNRTDEIYIGSTTESYLSARLAKHKNDYVKWKAGKTSKWLSSYNILQYDDVEIVLLESVEANDKDELRAKEQEHIEKNRTHATNIRSAFTGLSREEYAEKWYNDNYERLQEQRSEQILCECGIFSTRGHLATHRKSKIHRFYMSIINYAKSKMLR